MTRLLAAAREATARLVRARPGATEIQSLGQTLAREILGGDGTLWIMDSEGSLLFHTEPRFRDEYLSRRRSFGNIILVADHLAPRPPQAGVLFKVRLRDVASTYSEGCGTVRQFGVKRSLAFSKAIGLNLVVGVESPSAK